MKKTVSYDQMQAVKSDVRNDMAKAKENGYQETQTVNPITIKTPQGPCPAQFQHM